MKPILLLLFAATAACVGALLPLISRARSKRLLLNAVRRASSDAPDGIGISVLCSGVTDAAQIENLLSPEYSRYEVIVVLDARRHAAEFAALTARYIEPVQKGFTKYYQMVDGGDAKDYRFDAGVNLTVEEMGMPREIRFLSEDRKSVV